MIKKYFLLIIFFLFFLTFIGIFFYYYKKSGRFRRSIISAFIVGLAIFSGSLQVQASEAEAFTQKNVPRNRPANPTGFFGSASNNDGADNPGDNNSDGENGGELPKFFKREPVEKTESRVEEINKSTRAMYEVSDSDPESENEQNQCTIDENEWSIGKNNKKTVEVVQTYSVAKFKTPLNTNDPVQDVNDVIGEETREIKVIIPKRQIQKNILHIAVSGRMNKANQ